MSKKDQLNQPNKTSPTIAIIDGTGRTGRLVLEGALERRYVVRALARSPSKLNNNNKLTIIEGDADSLESLKELLDTRRYFVCCAPVDENRHYWHQTYRAFCLTSALLPLKNEVFDLRTWPSTRIRN
jgi:uncharacterized protein YbjT (DUF2867 family)